ncbi:MAG: ATP-dependent zinc metalloprotease FtsH [Lachnospiraceae bacterium]|nr:ATP-dependent zinc metalloprotease FtsH [Lachnospiraceae bacterium]
MKEQKKEKDENVKDKKDRELKKEKKEKQSFFSFHDENEENGQEQEEPKDKKRIFIYRIFFWFLLLLTFGVNIALFVKNQSEDRSHIEYHEFKQYLTEGNVEKVTIETNVLNIDLKEGEVKKCYTERLSGDTRLIEQLEEAGVKFVGKYNEDAYIWNLLLTSVLPLLIMVGLVCFMMHKMGGKGGIFGFGKSRAKVYVEKSTGVTFADVAGEEEAKESIKELVDFLHEPKKYQEIGARLPKGALLVGPPGTGKTLLAKAVAGEANVPFFSISGSDFVEMYVGVGASRVRDLFEQAKEMAPCIIFIDEIDAIGKKRDSGFEGGNDEREQTLNQLLAQMDGFDTSLGLIILAATNRPEVLDKALLRPGRFDRRVIVERPDLKGRVDILKVHAKNVKMDETVDFKEIALATAGAVGADLANIINEAALGAVKAGRAMVSQADLFEAVEVVILGKEKKDKILSEKEREIVAYHEIGHALASALLKHTEPVQKITIIPRTMGALGYVLHVPEEEKNLRSKQEMLDSLVGLVAGRAAEEVVFQSITTGASNDIEQATELARSMVTQYGMSERFGLMALESIQDRYLDGRPVLKCSAVTETKIDEEVKEMLGTAYKKAVSLLSEHREDLERLAQYLLKEETITGKKFMEILKNKDTKEGDSECTDC